MGAVKIPDYLQGKLGYKIINRVTMKDMNEQHRELLGVYVFWGGVWDWGLLSLEHTKEGQGGVDGIPLSPPAMQRMI